MSIYSMSKDRFILGLGTSGPQMIEGFNGVVFDHPIQRTREIIEIVRRVFHGEPVAYQGLVHQLPVREGQGKTIRSAIQPMPDIPIYISSLGPRNLRLTGELADGWKGTSSLGAMGSRQFNFYNAACSRAGYGEVAKRIQDPGRASESGARSRYSMNLFQVGTSVRILAWASFTSRTVSRSRGF